MPDLTVPLGDIWMIPIVPLRLEFAELVRRAIGSAAQASSSVPGRRDCVAVVLPESARSTVLEGVARLPQVSLAMSQIDEGAQEVVPVTPADGMIEAIRIALENECTVEFVDHDIAPRLLVSRVCSRPPDWPDDGLILRVGVKRYLEVVRPMLDAPPARLEPVDTWREHHIASKVRALLPRFRRIVLVCDVALAANLQWLLANQPMAALPDELLEPAARGYHLVQPSPVTLQHYLDDYPKLVETFDAQRSASATFDKRAALLAVLHEAMRSSGGRGLSPRTLQTFEAMLANVLSGTRRWVPPPHEFLRISRVCFGDSVTSDVARRLITYGDQLKITRARFLETIGGDLELAGEQAAGSTAVIRRTCSRAPQTWERVVPRWPAPQEHGERNIYRWPPLYRLFSQLRRKALACARQGKQESQSVPFMGCLWDGIDYRKTLRASLMGKQTLYVRRGARRPSAEIDDEEPVVWIANIASRGVSGIHLNVEQIKSPYVSMLRIYNKAESLHQEPGLMIYRMEVPSISIFSDDDYDRDTSHKMFSALKDPGRLPNHDSWQHSELGCEEPIITHLVGTQNWNWTDAQLVSAASYARRDVVCVVPDGFSFSPRVLQHRLCQGKLFHLVPHWKFSHRDRNAASSEVGVYTTEEDLTREDVLTRYSELVDQFWGPWP